MKHKCAVYLLPPPDFPPLEDRLLRELEPDDLLLELDPEDWYWLVLAAC